MESTFNPSKTVQLSLKSNESSTYTIETSSITKVVNHRDLSVNYLQIFRGNPTINILPVLLRHTFSVYIPITCKKQLYISSLFMYVLVGVMETIP